MPRTDLEAILATLHTDTAEFNSDDFRARILATYDEDITIRDTAVQDREQRLAGIQDELNRQKVKNYDLLQKIPADSTVTQLPGRQSGDPETDVSVDDLFGKG
jgi:hypothetical protein